MSTKKGIVVFFREIGQIIWCESFTLSHDEKAKK